MSENPSRPKTATPARSKHWGCLIFVVIAIVVGGFWWWRNWNSAQAAPATTTGGKRGARGSANGPVPVTVAPVKRENFDEWVSIAGTVTPLSVVTVRSRVDGELQKVLFTEGQTVKVGDLLAEIDPRPFQVQLDQAKAGLVRDQALLENARADLSRYQALLKQNSIEKQKVDTQASLVQQYDASLVSDQSMIANADLQLSYTKIASPIAGRVGLRQIDAGNMIHSSDANGLVVVAQINPIGLVFSVPQELVVPVTKRLAGSGPVAVEALDKEMNTSLSLGRLLTTDNQIDLGSGTLKLKAEMPNDDGLLFPNQFVVARLLVDVRKDATVAPSIAIQRGTKGAYAYVLNADGSVALRDAETGPVDGDRIVITEGLKPGDKVVTQGVDRLRDGAKVEVIERKAAKPKTVAEGGEAMRKRDDAKQEKTPAQADSKRDKSPAQTP